MWPRASVEAHACAELLKHVVTSLAHRVLVQAFCRGQLPAMAACRASAPGIACAPRALPCVMRVKRGFAVFPQAHMLHDGATAHSTPGNACLQRQGWMWIACECHVLYIAERSLYLNNSTHTHIARGFCHSA